MKKRESLTRRRSPRRRAIRSDQVHAAIAAWFDAECFPVANLETEIVSDIIQEIRASVAPYQANIFADGVLCGLHMANRRVTI
jgi:hypothetical protein